MNQSWIAVAFLLGAFAGVVATFWWVRQQIRNPRRPARYIRPVTDYPRRTVG